MFKEVIYFFLYLVRSILKPIFNFKEITVLLYHSVAKNNWYASVNPEDFDRQMKYLKDNYKVVSLKEIISYQKGEIDLPQKSVAITFDDGYKDNYEIAWPIFKKYNLPFTIFVTTNLENNQGMNNDFPRLAWPQIKEMASEGVTIGGHGANHRDLDKLDDMALKAEITDCQKILENELGKNSWHFSYPGGKYNQPVIKAVKEAGFISACTTQQGLVKKGDDIYQIKRIWVHRGLSFLAFKARLTKVADWLTSFK